jgi:hypothetical protein
MWVAMSAAEREEFLAGVHVGVLSAAAGTAGRTLAVPVWYSYQPGGLLTVLTGRRSRKAAAIRAAGRFGLCVQDTRPPYRYVSAEGPIVSEEEPDPAERLAMARRYLGAAGGDRYLAGNPAPRSPGTAGGLAGSPGAAAGAWIRCQFTVRWSRLPNFSRRAVTRSWIRRRFSSLSASARKVSVPGVACMVHRPQLRVTMPSVSVHSACRISGGS